MKTILCPLNSSLIIYIYILVIIIYWRAGRGTGEREVPPLTPEVDENQNNCFLDIFSFRYDNINTLHMTCYCVPNYELSLSTLLIFIKRERERERG